MLQSNGSLGAGGIPYCRIRLEAVWRPSTTPEGEIDAHLFWIRSDAPEPEPEDKLPVQSYDRARIQVLYVPAARGSYSPNPSNFWFFALPLDARRALVGRSA